ncbi:MAG: endo-1,4-beta-xylanase [Hyphomicrobiales bacterium]|nr:endo-1,4-beta-xylanase [Hyphomicrobiales bacterium]
MAQTTHGFSRRSLLQSALASCCAAPARAFSPQCRPGEIAPAPAALPFADAEPLGVLAARRNLQFGVQVGIADKSYGGGMYDPVYQQLILREQPQFLVYGSAFKFIDNCADAPGPDRRLRFSNARHGVRDTWYQANDITAFAKRHGLRGRADTLVWQNTHPAWLDALAARDWRQTPQYRSNMAYLDQYISAAMKKIVELSAGDAAFFQAIGVVNEPLDPFNPVGGMASYAGGPFLPPGQPCGPTAPPDYIATAFQKVVHYNDYWSRELGLPPTSAKLFINETTAETDQFGPLVRPALLALVKAMKNAGLRLDAVGLECHLQPQMMNNPQSPDWTAFGAFLQELSDLGVEIYITEFDVLDYAANCAGEKAPRQAADDLVSRYCQSFLETVLKYPAVKSISVWDLSDRYSFYRMLDVAQWYGYHKTPAGAHWPKCEIRPASRQAIACPRPALFDDAMIPKSARAAFARALQAR